MKKENDFSHVHCIMKVIWWFPSNCHIKKFYFKQVGKNPWT